MRIVQGWSSWYGFTQNINEKMLRGMADGMVSSGLRDAGYEHIWIDDGWALPRDNITHKPGGGSKYVSWTSFNIKTNYTHTLYIYIYIYNFWRKELIYLK